MFAFVFVVWRSHLFVTGSGQFSSRSMPPGLARAKPDRGDLWERLGRTNENQANPGQGDLVVGVVGSSEKLSTFPAAPTLPPAPMLPPEDSRLKVCCLCLLGSAVVFILFFLFLSFVRV